jgi:hypothetical protein
MYTCSYEELTDVKPCKHCGCMPKLATIFYENGTIRQEIICDSANVICVGFNYVKVQNMLDLDSAKQEWNKQNCEK